MIKHPTGKPRTCLVLACLAAPRSASHRLRAAGHERTADVYRPELKPRATVAEQPATWV